MKSLACAVAVALVFGIWTSGTASAACSGDCSGDGTVSIDELILGVNIALGGATVSRCGSLDADGDGVVAINEIIGAVNSALGGCSVTTPQPTASPTATPVSSDGLFISNAPPEAGSTFSHHSPITPDPVVISVPGILLNVTWAEFRDPVTVGSFHGAVNEALSISINLANGQLTNASYGVSTVPGVGSTNLTPSSYGLVYECPANNPCNAAARGVHPDLEHRTVAFDHFRMPRLNGQGVTEYVEVNGTIGF